MKLNKKKKMRMEWLSFNLLDKYSNSPTITTTMMKKKRMTFKINKVLERLRASDLVQLPRNSKTMMIWLYRLLL